MGTVSPIVTAITGYVEQRRLPLLTKAVFGPKTRENFTIQAEVKHKSNLNTITTVVAAADAKECGFTYDSTQTLSKRELVVNNLKYEVAYCVRALLDTWMGYQVAVAGADALPFEEYFINDLVKNIGVDADKKIWAGRQAGASSPFVAAQTDGLIQLALADSTVTDVTIVAGTTKYAAVKQMIAAIPAAILGEAVIFASPEFVIGYTEELVDLNLFHYMPGEAPDDVIVPGTRVKLIPAVGLTGVGYLFASYKGNLHYGMDYADDDTSMRSWYSADNDQVRVRCAFNAGAQYAFGSEVVLGELQ